MNLYEEVEKIKASGYNEQNAQSKLGQDIVLKNRVIFLRHLQ